MLRIVLGVIGGFIGWMMVWIGTEKGLSALWPAFGVHQKAFEEVVKNGGAFTADTGLLLPHIIMAAIVSLVSGAIAALIAGENARAPFYLGIALLAMGLAKAYMSWQYVPLWYHIIFTALLLPLAILGGKLISNA